MDSSKWNHSKHIDCTTQPLTYYSVSKLINKSVHSNAWTEYSLDVFGVTEVINVLPYGTNVFLAGKQLQIHVEIDTLEIFYNDPSVYKSVICDGAIVPAFQQCQQRLNRCK